jgi:hypothetical protein
MQRHAPAVLAVALGLASLAPPALCAQYRAAQTVAAARSHRVDEVSQPARTDRPLPPRLPAASDSSPRSHSLGRHLLVGAGVGAAAGLAIGIISRNHSSDCSECVPPASAIPVLGAVAGAVAGTLVGWVVYLGRSGAPAESTRGRGPRRPAR